VKADVLTQEEVASVAFSCLVLGLSPQLNELLGQLEFAKMESHTCKFVLCFCKVLSSMAQNIVVSDAEQTILADLETEFYNETHKEIEYNASCIGQPFSYQQLYSKILSIYR
jgi:hypothetical protein